MPDAVARPGHAAAGPPRVSLVGPLNLDLFVRGSAPTDPGELNAWVGPSEVELLVAGSIGYPAQAFARLGARVELHSHVGDDGFGAHIRSTLVGAGVADRFLVTMPGQSAIAIYLLLFGGQKRPMTYRLPGSPAWPAQPAFIRPGEPVPDLVHSGGLLHFPDMWHSGLAPSFRRARDAGATTSIDPQFPLDGRPAPWAPHLADVLAVSDILLCDEHELHMLFDGPGLEEDLRAAHAVGPRIVVVKRGAAGSLVSGDGVVIEQPAVPVPPPDIREAVGAGDAYDAGFLDSFVRGAPLAAAAAFGTATAALTLTARGGAEGIVDRDAVLATLPRVPEATVRS
jgi:sugar/nucleoside kinase (ribokinase family)